MKEILAEVISSAGPLEVRVMGDPCPCCGGTDYYCVEQTERHIKHLLGELERAGLDLADWGSVFGHLSYEPDKAGNMINQKMDDMRAEIERLRGALERVMRVVESRGMTNIGVYVSMPGEYTGLIHKMGEFALRSDGCKENET